MDLGLTGKVAIITGSGRGIGAMTAATLAGEGANVVIAITTSPECRRKISTR